MIKGQYILNSANMNVYPLTISGCRAGNYNTSGNINIGYQALSNVTTGTGNTAIGYRSGYSVRCYFHKDTTPNPDYPEHPGCFRPKDNEVE